MAFEGEIEREREGERERENIRSLSVEKRERKGREREDEKEGRCDEWSVAQFGAIFCLGERERKRLTYIGRERESCTLFVSIQ